eukprot:176452_1
MDAKDDTRYKGEYEWNISGNKLSQMMNAKNKEKFVSDTFEMGSMNWCIKVCPNGSKDNDVGAFKVFLKLLSSPQQQQSIASAAYLSNINEWKCPMCDTNNLNSSYLCKLCGLKKNYMNNEIEGP